MKLQKRFWPLLLMGIALTAIILLSAGINDLEFLPGKTFKIGFKPADTTVKEDADADDYTLFLFRLLMVGYLACIPIIFFLLSPRRRIRALLFLVLLFFLFTFLIDIAVSLIGLLKEAFQLPTLMVLFSPGRNLDDTAIQFAPSPPQWLTVIVSTGVAMILVFAAFFLVQRFFTRRSSSSDPLRNTIQDALQELQEGADLKDTVVRCYNEMGRVLMKKRGITRREDMTPREFESSLRYSGLPNESLFELTRLFEEIRYGNKAPGERENNNAIRCLEAIIKACETEQ